MAQADSVPILIPRAITGATVNPSTEHARRRWYQAVTGRMPIGPYVVIALYATTVILVGPAPWNTLLILTLLLSRDEVLQWWIGGVARQVAG